MHKTLSNLLNLKSSVLSGADLCPARNTRELFAPRINAMKDAAMNTSVIVWKMEMRDYEQTLEISKPPVRMAKHLAKCLHATRLQTC